LLHLDCKPEQPEQHGNRRGEPLELSLSISHPSEPRWLRSEIRGEQYVVAGSPDQLMDLFIAFRTWATNGVTPASPPHGA
jgi:hypothetical protein